MTALTKLWLLRCVSVPVLLVLPLLCNVYGLLLAKENKGDSYPLFAMFGFFAGLIVAVVLTRWALFAAKGEQCDRRLRIMTVLAVFEAIAFLMLRFWLFADTAAA